MIIYLGLTSRPSSSDRPIPNRDCLVFHPGKDLAVSPLDFARGKPQTTPRARQAPYARRLDTFAPQRLCSHLFRQLAETGVTRYLALRFYIEGVFGLSSLNFTVKSNHLVYYII